MLKPMLPSMPVLFSLTTLIRPNGAKNNENSNYMKYERLDHHPPCQWLGHSWTAYLVRVSINKRTRNMYMNSCTIVLHCYSFADLSLTQSIMVSLRADLDCLCKLAQGIYARCVKKMLRTVRYVRGSKTPQPYTSCRC